MVHMLLATHGERLDVSKGPHIASSLNNHSAGSQGGQYCTVLYGAGAAGAEVQDIDWRVCCACGGWRHRCASDARGYTRVHAVYAVIFQPCRRGFNQMRILYRSAPCVHSEFCLSAPNGRPAVARR